MAITIEQMVQQQLGQQAMLIAAQQVQIEQLKEALAAAGKPAEPAQS